MDRREIELTLQHFLRTYLRNGLVNRLIAFALLNLAAYIYLLTVMILADTSLFVFHFIFFCSLSLLPLFLFLGMEKTTLSGLIRTVDERCLIESYLHTPSDEHRSFMQGRVESLLVRKKSARVFPFRLFAVNIHLIGLCIFAFVLLQVVSFITLRDFTTVFSAQNIKTRLLKRSILRDGIDELPAEELPTADSADPGQEDSAAAGGQTIEQRAARNLDEEALEEVLGEDKMVAKDRIERLSPEDLRQEADPKAESSQPGGNYQVLDIEAVSDPENPQRLPGNEDQETAREGSGAEAGSSDVGRTYKESPLREYTTVPEQLTARGNEQLSPTGDLTESRERIYLEALFADFVPRTGRRITFNPLFETIRERYLELLNERF